MNQVWLARRWHVDFMARNVERTAILQLIRTDGRIVQARLPRVPVATHPTDAKLPARRDSQTRPRWGCKFGEPRLGLSVLGAKHDRPARRDRPTPEGSAGPMAG